MTKTATKEAICEAFREQCNCCLLSFCFPSALHPLLGAQQGEEAIREVKVTDVDSDAAREAGPGRVHALATNVAGALALLLSEYPTGSAVLRRWASVVGRYSFSP